MSIIFENASFRLPDYTVNSLAREISHYNGATFRVESDDTLSLLFNPGEQKERLVEMFYEAKQSLITARRQEALQGNVGRHSWSPNRTNSSQE